jgi:peptidoglycan/LPS O-acetylase OafA/YrhL
VSGERKHGAPAVPVGIRSSAYLPELESLRGIAVMLVVAFHTDAFVRFGQRPPSLSPLMGFVRAGHTGVDLFFLLSGFLLSGPFLGPKAVDLRAYFARRALRILPLYWTAVVVATVLTAAQVRDLLHAIPYLVFLNSFPDTYTPMNPYSGVWWSLATEVQFYFLLPLLPLVVRSPSGRRIGALLLVLYALAYVAVVFQFVNLGSVNGYLALMCSVFGRGPLFLWGILAAAIHRRHGGALTRWLARVPLLRNGGADVILVAILVAMAFFYRWLVDLGDPNIQGMYQPWHIANGALWAAVVLILLVAPLRLKPLFSNAMLGGLGVLSYSIYMIHAPFMLRWVVGLGAIGWSPRTGAIVAALASACVALSALSYRVIERPFLVRKARAEEPRVAAGEAAA